MKKYKVRLSADASKALCSLLDKVITNEDCSDSGTKIMIAGMAEVSIVIRKKMLEYKTNYSYSFSAVQAFALQLLYEYYVEPNGMMTGYLENQLRKIANEVHQKYTV